MCTVLTVQLRKKTIWLKSMPMTHMGVYVLYKCFTVIDMLCYLFNHVRVLIPRQLKMGKIAEFNKYLDELKQELDENLFRPSRYISK